MSETLDPLDPSAYWKPYREHTRRKWDVFSFQDTYAELLQSCEKLAYLTRSYSVYEMTCGALGHPGGSFSEADLLAVLYNYALRFDAGEPDWTMRDIFYLSKCHTAPALYTVLALFGYFPLEKLKYYGSWDSGLESHPDWRVTPGIEISGGSLGQIPGVAVGRALGIRRKGPDHNDRIVYVLLGDGECNEGSVWEAAMSAAHFKADNLIAIVDCNKIQYDGPTCDILNMADFKAKWVSFGWDTVEIAGHCVREIYDALKNRNYMIGKPYAVIAHTVKGKGVSFMENNKDWHHARLTKEQYDKAMADLDAVLKVGPGNGDIKP